MGTTQTPPAKPKVEMTEAEKQLYLQFVAAYARDSFTGQGTASAVGGAVGTGVLALGYAVGSGYFGMGRTVLGMEARFVAEEGTAGVVAMEMASAFLSAGPQSAKFLQAFYVATGIYESQKQYMDDLIKRHNGNVGEALTSAEFNQLIAGGVKGTAKGLANFVFVPFVLASKMGHDGTYVVYGGVNHVFWDTKGEKIAERLRKENPKLFQTLMQKLIADPHSADWIAVPERYLSDDKAARDDTILLRGILDNDFNFRKSEAFELRQVGPLQLMTRLRVPGAEKIPDTEELWFFRDRWHDNVNIFTDRLGHALYNATDAVTGAGEPQAPPAHVTAKPPKAPTASPSR